MILTSFFPLPENWLAQLASSTAIVFTDISPIVLVIVAVLLAFTGIGLLISFFHR
jgi:hypothetical protein